MANISGNLNVANVFLSSQLCIVRLLKGQCEHRSTWYKHYHICPIKLMDPYNLLGVVDPDPQPGLLQPLPWVQLGRCWILVCILIGLHVFT